MLRRVFRIAVIGAAVLVALALAVRALVNRRRPADPPVASWPVIPAVPESPDRRVEPESPDSRVEPESPDSRWVEPDGSSCPVSHPVKAKLSSGIFHSPGGLNYERTKPDRCYPDAEAAEADGLRASKR